MKRTEELHLDRERHLRDLVEEDRSAVGVLHEPHAVRVRSREGAANVPEQLALEELLGNRGGIHGHEGSVGAAALEVDRGRDHLLSRSAFSGDEDGAFRGRDLRDEPKNPLEGGTLPDHVLGDGPAARPFRDVGRLPESLHRRIAGGELAGRTRAHAASAAVECR